MPSITGTIRSASGDPLEVGLIFVRIGQAGRIADDAISRGVVQESSAVDGTFSVALGGGTWRMEWYADGLRSEMYLGIPGTGGPYALADVSVTAETASTAGGSGNASLTWFGSIAAMLAADSATWTLGRTLNSYGTDGIRTAWDCLLKSDPAASSVTANGDSVLETDDGLAFALRGTIYA